MRKMWWLIQFTFYAFVGAWFHLNPGSVYFEWLGYEGHTSIALLLLIGVLCWAIGSIISTWRAVLQRLWARLWGHRLPFEADLLMQPSFKTLLYQGGVYHLYPQTLGCDEGRFSEQYIQEQRSYCDKLIQNRSTAWWGYWGLIQLYYRAGECSQAHVWAAQAHKAYPRHHEMTHMYFVTSLLSEHYDEALKLIPLLRRQGICSRAQERRLTAQVRLMRSQYRQDEEGLCEELAHIVRADSTFEPALRAWCFCLKQTRQTEHLTLQIRRRWSDTGGSIPLGQLYLDVLGWHGIERFKAAVELTQQGGLESTNHALLGIEALRAGLWGEARRYLRLVYAQTHHTFFERMLAYIDRAEHRAQGGALDFGESNVDADDPIPFLNEGPWVCRTCGHGQREVYDGLCVSCGFWSSLSFGMYSPLSLLQRTSPSALSRLSYARSS